MTPAEEEAGPETPSRHWSVKIIATGGKASYSWDGFAQDKDHATRLARSCMAASWAVLALATEANTRPPRHLMTSVVADSQAASHSAYKVEVHERMLTEVRALGNRPQAQLPAYDIERIVRLAHEEIVDATGIPGGGDHSYLLLSLKTGATTMPETDPCRASCIDRTPALARIRSKTIPALALMALTAAAARETLVMEPSEHVGSQLGDEPSATARTQALNAIRATRAERGQELSAFLKSCGLDTGRLAQILSRTK